VRIVPLLTILEVCSAQHGHHGHAAFVLASPNCGRA
jgi:hypothetical protein